MEWAGLVGILVAAAVFDSSTQFPGVVVALPVIATCLILAGGSARCGTVPERLLGLGPFQILGAISYSLYLWHWPILTIAAQRTGSPVPLWANALLIAVAVGLSALTYALVENPVRNSTFLRRRPVLTIAIGALLITSSFAVAAMITASHPVQIIDTPVPQ
jgi:peptidoglycan/LPS O-acetylase OafA/YrhL